MSATLASDDAAMPAHARDVVDYTLRATLDPGAHTVHGEGTIFWRNTSEAPTSELWVHLYLNAFKNERSAFFRERVGGRGSEPPTDWGYVDLRRLSLRDAAGGPSTELWHRAELLRPGDADETDARVPLPRPVVPGEQIVLDIAFDDKLPPVVERTGYRGHFHMVGQWFPKIARLEADGRWAHFPFHHLAEFYADFGTYDVTLDVPDTFIIGATGPTVESRVSSHRRIERHVQADVHDFAWAAFDAFERMRERVAGVDVVVLYPPGCGPIARRELDTLRFALPYYSARYGHYPYGVLTVIHPPEDAAEAGGMEYPTLITSGGAWWTPPGVLMPELVTIHELGHQWFYGLVATNELAWPMLDEGINQYAEVDALGKWRGAGSFVDMAGLRISDAAVQAVGGNIAVHDEPVAQSADSFSTGAAYGRLVYARTASVLATLARVYGDDAVALALGSYARRFRFQHPEPEQLVDSFRQVLGDRAASTLFGALFEKGWVDYVVDGVWSHEAKPAAGVFDHDGIRDRETVDAVMSKEGDWEGSVLVRRRGDLSFPVDVELSFADGSSRREHWDGTGDWKRFVYRGPTALLSAAVDPDDRVLVDENLTNNSGIAARERASWVLQTFERVTYWLELALQVVSP